MQKISIKAVIVAAGSGKRFNAKANKPYVRLEGFPLLYHSVLAFESNPNIDEIIIVAAEEKLAYCRRNIVEKYGFKKVSAVVAGGAERQLSVKNGLGAIDCGARDIILIHDGARPFVTRKTVNAVIDAAKKHGAAVPGTTPKATIKEVSPAGTVKSSLVRNSLREIQTPQGFRFKLLKAAYSAPDRILKTLTDDASVVERHGRKVKVVEADESNIKITTALDLEIGKLILKQTSKRKIK